MPKITLADIREAADRKYGPFIVELPDGSELPLQSMLRLPGKKRGQLMRMAQEFSEMGRLFVEDPELDFASKIEEALRILAPSKAVGDKLIKACDHDAGVLMEVFAGYMEASQPGEASPSES